MSSVYKPSPAPMIEASGLKKYYAVQAGWLSKRKALKAVDGVDLHVAAGECLGLVGESGCGKTTVGRALLRLLEPTAGSVRFKGVDLLTLKREELRGLRPKLQLVFQDPFASLNPLMTVEEIVGDVLLAHGMARGNQRREKVSQLLAQVGLGEEALTRFPHEFSGGQRQRIGIARALAPAPEFVVLDEAVSALDVSVRAQILNLLSDLRERSNIGFLFISHDLSVVRHLADRICVMYLGRIVEEAPTEDFFLSPLHPYSSALIAAIPRLEVGSRRSRNVLPGEVPSLLDPPSGCPFHPRCTRAVAQCEKEVPPMRPMSDQRRVACHRAGEGEE